MRFSVASWHSRSVAYWLDHGAYTMMASPPEWAKQHKRNLDLFTPPTQIVFGGVSEAEYTRIFRSEMQRKIEAIKKWIDLQGDRHVILLCACADGKFCHRLLVRKLLLWLGCEEVALPDEVSEPMQDIVVTVPKSFGLDTWIAEGDPAGAPWSGEEWHFYLGTLKPNVQPGARVYVVYNGILRGYAPLVRVESDADDEDTGSAGNEYFNGGWGDDTIRLGRLPQDAPRYALVRHGGAVAVTIDEHIPGFRGFRARWWDYDQEKPFDQPWYDGRPMWQVAMEWERVPHQGKMALCVDGIPIAAYWKEGGSWHCSKCDDPFSDAASVQAHIKASADHIEDGVHYYLDYRKQHPTA